MGKSHDLATLKDDGGTINGALTVDERLTLDTTLGQQQLDITGVEADIWLNSTGPNKTWRILGSTGSNTHKFRVYDQSNDAERFGIDASGHVTMPYQPAFCAYSDTFTASGNYYFSSYNITDKQRFNRGNHFNTSTGVFTAPVSGIYQAGYIFGGSASTTRKIGRVYWNSQTTVPVGEVAEDSDQYADSGGSFLITMSANDTLRWATHPAGTWQSVVAYAHLIG